ncbi:MAG: hypothetical protein HC912_01495 [Saprospiraceae bacterium]|nr:hypothetical protein [Saprospiraceae bacterium]
MLCTKLKEQVKAQKMTHYQALFAPCEEWSEKHFQFASEIIGISHSTLRRIYLPQNYVHEGFNKRTKLILAAYLGFDNWDDLVSEISEQILTDWIKEKQN